MITAQGVGWEAQGEWLGMGKAWTYVPGFGASMASRLGTSKPHTRIVTLLDPCRPFQDAALYPLQQFFPIARVQASPSGRFVTRFESLPRR